MNNALASLNIIRNVIRAYHLALDKREHGGVAADHALQAIQEELEMPWQQGKELEVERAVARLAQTGKPK